MRAGVLAAVLLLVAGVVVSTAGGVPTAAPTSAVDPAEVTEQLDPGESLTVGKKVTTPVVPPRPDVVLLVDGTGSMAPTIRNVQDNLATITSRVREEQHDSRFAVATYGDRIDPARVFTVLQGLTYDLDDVQRGVDRLDTDRGQNSPGPAEDWINALWQIGNGAGGRISFREGASPVVVLVGDASSHDPSMGHTLTDAMNALRNVHARVIGVDVATDLGDGLDGNGDNGNGPGQNQDELHEPGQATKVTRDSGGRLFSHIDADQVADTVAEGLTNLRTTVSHQTVGCDPALSVALSPASLPVTSGDVASFEETITVADDAPQGVTLSCTVQFLLDGKAPGGEAPVDVTPAREFRGQTFRPDDLPLTGGGTSAGGTGGTGGVIAGAVGGVVGGTGPDGGGLAAGAAAGVISGPDGCGGGTLAGLAAGAIGGHDGRTGGLIAGALGGVISGSDGCGDGGGGGDGGDGGGDGGGSGASGGTSTAGGASVGALGGLIGGGDTSGLIGGVIAGVTTSGGATGGNATGGNTTGGDSANGGTTTGSGGDGNGGNGNGGGNGGNGGGDGNGGGNSGGQDGGNGDGNGGGGNGGGGNGGDSNGNGNGGDSGNGGNGGNGDNGGDGGNGGGNGGGNSGGNDPNPPSPPPTPEDYQQHITITVDDVTAPVVTVDDRTAEASGGKGTVIDYTATAEDAVDGELPVTCTPESGTRFPVGTTTVTCSATDAAGNTGTDTATFTVTPPPVPNEADIAVRATVPTATGYTGLPARAAFTLTNAGPRTAKNVVLTTAWPRADGDSATRTLSALPKCTRAKPCTLRPGARVTVAQYAVYDTAVRGEIRASVTGSPGDPRKTNNTDDTRIRVLQPKLTVTPTAARPGDVVLARGKDFPPGRTVTLSWSPGITAARSEVRVGRDGIFEAQVLVLRKDRLGPRTLRAEMRGLDRLTKRVLIVRRYLQPPDFAGRR